MDVHRGSANLTAYAGEAIEPKKDVSPRGAEGKFSEQAGEVDGIKVELALRSPFNGGAIVKTCADGHSSVFVLAGMPEGFSIYLFNVEDGSYEKLISATFLERMFPSGTDPTSVSIACNSSGSVLALYTQTPPRLILLNVTRLPKVKKYSFNLPASFVPGGLDFFSDGRVLVSSRGFSPRLINYPLLLYDLGSNRLEPVRLNTEFGIVREARLLDDSTAVLVGYFNRLSSLSAMEIGVLDVNTGALRIWDYTHVVLAVGNKRRVALVRQRQTVGETNGGEGAEDKPMEPSYELLMLTKEGNAFPGSISIPVYGNPIWLSLLQGTFRVHLISEDESGVRSLWLIDGRDGAKKLISKNVQRVEVMEGGKKVVVLPTDENALLVYRVDA